MSLSDFLTLFSARTQGPCFLSRPSLKLLGAAAVALCASSLLASFWPAALNQAPLRDLDGQSLAASAPATYDAVRKATGIRMDPAPAALVGATARGARCARATRCRARPDAALVRALSGSTASSGG